MAVVALGRGSYRVQIGCSKDVRTLRVTELGDPSPGSQDFFPGLSPVRGERYHGTLVSKVRVSGGLAEWLGSGLQSRVQRFESATRLFAVSGFTKARRRCFEW
jgi:hypothetical protein